MSTVDYLDQLKARYNWNSDYKLAKELGISQSRISNYRSGKQNMDDELAIRIEKLLALPEGTILLDMYASRTKSPEAKKILARLSKQTMNAFAATALMVTMSYMVAASPDLLAAEIIGGSNTVYYVKSHPDLITFAENNKTLISILFCINRYFLCKIVRILTK